MLSTQAAIVLGLGLAGAFVGAGVFFALRPAAVTPTGTSAPAASASVTSARPGAPSPDTTPTAPLGTGPASIAPPAEAMQGSVNDEVAHGFEAQRARLVASCWAPSFAKQPAPATTTLFFTLTFAEDGHLVSRGLRQDLPTARPDVAACVQRSVVIPPIAPRGARARIEYALTLP